MTNAFSILDKKKKSGDGKSVVSYKTTSSGGRVPIFPKNWKEYCGNSLKTVYPKFNPHGYKPPKEIGGAGQRGTVFKKFSGDSPPKIGKE